MALLLTLCGVIAGNNLALSWLVTLLTTLGVLVKGWVDVRNTGRKEEISRFAYTNHEKTLIELRTFVRGVVPTELTGFLIKQQTVEDLITDFAPCKRTSFRYRCNCGDCVTRDPERRSVRSQTCTLSGSVCKTCKKRDQKSKEKTTKGRRIESA